MGKSVNLLLGSVLGIAVGLAVGYVLAPARDTSFEAGYQSRLDKALAEGRKAAAQREAELRAEYERAKRQRRPGQSGA
ncbi:MAG: hypothetical protein R2873_11455 [Caldilineaceae bacterium]|nr:hypothetical protein [Caldilineaceae bacterium]